MLGERCQVRTSLDEKGRVGLPARLRHKLKEAGIDALVLTCVDGGIRAFVPDYFARRIEGPFSDKDPFDPGAQAYFHAVLADAEDCNLDGQGRLRIPARLREDARLERDVVVISVMDWLEFWDPQEWEAVRARAKSDYQRLRSTPRPAQD